MQWDMNQLQQPLRCPHCDKLFSDLESDNFFPSILLRWKEFVQHYELSPDCLIKKVHSE